MSLSKLNVLLIDDLDINYKTLKSQLSLSLPSDSFEIKFFRFSDNIEQLRQILTDCEFDLVFVDIVLNEHDKDNNIGKDIMELASLMSAKSRVFLYSAYLYSVATIRATNYLKAKGVSYTTVLKESGTSILDEIRSDLQRWSIYMFFVEMAEEDTQHVLDLLYESNASRKALSGNEIVCVRDRSYHLCTLFPFIVTWDNVTVDEILTLLSFDGLFPCLSQLELWNRESEKNEYPVREYYREYYFNSKYAYHRLALRRKIVRKLNNLLGILLVESKFRAKPHYIPLLDFRDEFIGNFLQKIELSPAPVGRRSVKTVFEPDRGNLTGFSKYAMEIFERRLVGRIFFICGIMFLDMKKEFLYNLLQKGLYDDANSNSVGLLLTQCFLLNGLNASNFSFFSTLSLDERNWLSSWWDGVEDFVKDNFEESSALRRKLEFMDERVRINIIKRY